MPFAYEQLEVWKKARWIVKEIYILTEKFPTQEQYGLTSQLRRAATSIVANIAEGSGRRSTKDYIHFISIAQGSLYEVHAHLTMANDVGYTTLDSDHKIWTELRNIDKMLDGLITSLERKLNSVDGAQRAHRATEGSDTQGPGPRTQ